MIMIGYISIALHKYEEHITSISEPLPVSCAFYTLIHVVTVLISNMENAFP